MRIYRYVGPAEIFARAIGRPAGVEVRAAVDVTAWIAASKQEADGGGLYAATFVVDARGRLLIADRRSEHVQCAGGGDVTAAGEIFFDVAGSRVVVAEVTNQSTGYCPEPDCWEAVAAALDRIELPHPGGFTTTCVFRRCAACGARNLVKDEWFYCDVCGAELLREWNFG